MSNKLHTMLIFLSNLFLLSTTLTSAIPLLENSFVHQNKSIFTLDDICLGCICEAASKCRLKLGCNDGFCGMFRVSLPYWQDAGMPYKENDKFEPDEEKAWIKCVRDPVCAATTVTNYMSKFQTDCNDDGTIDCFDFAAIHYFGGYDCDKPSTEMDKTYLNQFTQCML